MNSNSTRHLCCEFQIYSIFNPSVCACVAISQDGRLTTNALMAEYNQDRFELEIQAKEVQSPERTSMARVLVSGNDDAFV